MTQVIQHIAELPDSPLAASVVFFEAHLNSSRSALSEDGVTGLAIILPYAATDHDDWRRTLARDLAREFTPQRVNVVGGGSEKATEALTRYLADAPGVTGQYLAAHE